MGSFANSVFSVLLGWIRTAVNYAWSLLSGEEGNGLLAWIGEYWLTLAILICVAGIIVDGMVYLFRWRPFQVWAGFFRRLRGVGQEADEIALSSQEDLPAPIMAEEEPIESLPEPRGYGGKTWVYPDGTMWDETAYEAPVGELLMPSAMEARDGAYAAADDAAAGAQQTYYSCFARPQQTPAAIRAGSMGRAYRRPRAATPYVPQERQASAPDLTKLEDYPPPQGEIVASKETGETTLSPTKTIERPRNTVMQKITSPLRDLRQDENDLDYHYSSPAPAMDKREAYREPVYPPAWKQSSELGEQETRESWS